MVIKSAAQINTSTNDKPNPSLLLGYLNHSRLIQKLQLISILAGNLQHNVSLLQLVEHLVTRQEIVPEATMSAATQKLAPRVDASHTMEMLSWTKKWAGTGSGRINDVAVNIKLQP